MRISTISQILSLVLITSVIVVFLFSAAGFQDRSREMYTHVLEDTIRKYLILCYALEGSYPPDLEHLSRNYGLILDHANFIYDYRIIASNILPDIRVFVRTENPHQVGSIF